MKHRKVAHHFTTKEFLEGAGVKLHRGFSYMPENLFDPFLLFDDFSSENPVDYLAGFPWHPHRGIQTVTYILKGAVEHGDSLGNAGVIGKGDIQWMSAGSGIIHQEMPRGSSGLVGFQLWINMPANKKMSKPNYQEHIASLIPEFEYQEGVITRLIAGSLGNSTGPIKEQMTNPSYIDIQLKPNTEATFPVPDGYTAFIYVFEGSIHTDAATFGPGKVVLYERSGDMAHIKTNTSGARLVLIIGKPIKEPVAWYGPVVMNTQEELHTAFEELRDGTFIKT